MPTPRSRPSPRSCKPAAADWAPDSAGPAPGLFARQQPACAHAWPPAGSRSGARAADRGEERGDGAAQVGTGQFAASRPRDLVEQQAVDEGREIGCALVGLADTRGAEAVGDHGPDRGAGVDQGLPEFGAAGRLQGELVAGQQAFPPGGQPAFDEAIMDASGT